MPTLSPNWAATFRKTIPRGIATKRYNPGCKQPGRSAGIYNAQTACSLGFFASDFGQIHLIDQQIHIRFVEMTGHVGHRVGRPAGSG
jgi:hypothetical protein